MTKMKRLIAIIVLTLTLLPGIHGQNNRVELIKEYEDSLANVTTSRDSIRVMYNLFDLDSQNRRSHARKLMDMVNRHGTRSEIMDMIRQNVNLNHTDSLFLDSMQRSLRDYADSPEVMETRLFVKLYQIENASRNVDWEKRLRNGELSEMFVKIEDSIYKKPEDRIAALYSTVCSMAGLTRGPLMAATLDSLQSYVENVNLPTGAVRNFIYNRSCGIFSSGNNSVKVVETEKKLLNVIDSLSRAYARAGRPYRTLPVNRYISYRRMLQHSSALNDAEIEQFYNEVKQLAQTDSAVARDIAANPIVDVYYLAAKGKYAEAIPMIENMLARNNLQASQRATLYSILYDAAHATGNRSLMRTATEELYPIKLAELETREHYRLNDLRILYQSDSVRAAQSVQSDFARERQMTEKRAHTVIVIICIAALLFLAIFILFLARQRSKVMAIADRLTAANETLIQERNELRHTQDDLIEARDAAKAADRMKTDFINNMSHEIKTPLSAINEYSRLIVDCIPENQRKYLDKFASIININSRLIQTLVNDVLDVAALERKDMSITKEPIFAENICEVAIGNVFDEGRTEAGSEVRLIFLPMHPDVSLLTDPQRVGQVLTNLLSNAKKFTEKGMITLSYTLNSTDKTITFSVADTGSGIPSGMEEEIFSRFRQLDHTTQGSGLGLYISRLLANLLGGKIEVDKSYRGGARFLFTIPTGY